MFAKKTHSYLMKQFDLKQIHDALLGLLNAVDDFCRQHGIRYSLAYGTLLGAVRHKGFIPWDDDVDLLMPRPDFERFVATFGKDGGPYQCLYNTSTEDAHFVNFFAKVHDTRTISNEKRMKNYRFGLNIDIFPVDGKPDTIEEQTRHERKLAHYVHRIYLDQRPFFPFSFHDPLIPKIEAHCFSLEHWFRKTVDMMKSYDYETSKFCGSVTTRYNGLIEIFEKEFFEDYVELEFEGRKYMAFKDWDRFLKQQYGDYMQLPPENKRRTHELQVYLK